MEDKRIAENDLLKKETICLRRDGYKHPLSEEEIVFLQNKWSPKGSQLRSLQDDLLIAMKFLDTICVTHNIQYFLNAGTALGAVRHHGFIPWDDDMDIALLEKDYKRLIKVLKKLDDDTFVLQCQKTDCNYVNFFPKFRFRRGDCLGNNPSRGSLYKYQGPSIDIFCIQRNSYFGAYISGRVHNKLMQWTWKIRSETLRKVVTRILYFITKIITVFFRFFDFLRKPGEMHYSLGQGFPRHFFWEQDFNEFIRVDFSGLFLPIPANYDHFLTAIYGDWRRLPSDEQVMSTGIHQKHLIRDVIKESK